MAKAGLSRAQEQVNALLRFPLEKVEGAGVIAALESPDRATRREALREIEAHEADDRSPPLDVVKHICARAARIGGAEALESAVSPVYLTLDDLDPGMGPPEGTSFYNPYTGVVSIYPREGMSGEELLGEAANAFKGIDEVAGTEQVGIYRAISAFDPAYANTPEAEEDDEAEGLSATVPVERIPWGVSRIGAPAAWRRGHTGSGVWVAVVDTGIARHSDLPVPVRGTTLIPGSNSFNDDNGHGTHVAGTIAAIRRNQLGVVGVAPDVRLMAVKVLARDGFSRGDSVANGIAWAALNGAKVINLSLGSSTPRESMRRAVIFARSRGALLCAAAGNDYGGPVAYPAAFNDTCLAIAATTRTDQRAPYSNRGPEIDLAGPGSDTLSTYTGNNYATLNGTSMATPHVAGVAALVLGQRPGLTPLQLQRHLERTADPLGMPESFGRGLVNAGRAVATAPGLAADPPEPPSEPSDSDIPAGAQPKRRTRRNKSTQPE